MEKLWYNLSSNVLEKMIKFSSKSQSENCPNFILEIESVSSSLSRYVMNLIDGTKKSIMCVTSAEYFEKFPVDEAIAGNIIRIINYWLFQVETHHSNGKKPEYQYVVMISNAEIMKLGPAKSIASLTRPVSKSLRIRGIVDECFGVTNSIGGNIFFRFYLHDNTGSIGCKVNGVLCASLQSQVKEGVKMEIINAMVNKVDLAWKTSDNNFELNLNQFSILNIYEPNNLSLLYSHPSNGVEKKIKSNPCPIVESKPIQLTKPPIKPQISPEEELKKLVAPGQRCSNGKMPVAIASLKNIGICTSWIRGIVECHTGIAATRINTVFTRFHIRDYSTAIYCTVWEPIATPLNAILKDGVIVEIAGANVRSLNKALKISASNHEIFLTKFARVNALKPNGTILYQYKLSQSSNIEINDDYEISPELSIKLAQKLIDGKLPAAVSSLTKEGHCYLWIRGIMESCAGISTTKNCRAYLRFYIRDNTGAIHCTVWEPVCIPLHRVLKEGMIVETQNYTVSPVRHSYKKGKHKNEIYINEFSKVKVYNHDDILLYEYNKEKIG